MDGTELHGNGDVAEEPPASVVSIRLDALTTFSTVDDEGDPVLVVSDGETTIEFACGLPGLSDGSARGAQRLVEAIGTYQAEIEQRQRSISAGQGG
jgi:hypothetical protein